jgi:hypothetical protein
MASPNDAGQLPARSNNLSKAAAVLGAAGLLLYIMGVKRRHRLDNERETAEARRSERRDG